MLLLGLHDILHVIVISSVANHRTVFTDEIRMTIECNISCSPSSYHLVYKTLQTLPRSGAVHGDLCAYVFSMQLFSDPFMSSTCSLNYDKWVTAKIKRLLLHCKWNYSTMCFLKPFSKVSRYRNQLRKYINLIRNTKDRNCKALF